MMVTDENTLKILEKEVLKLNKEIVSKKIEDYVWKDDISYYEALLKVVKEEEIEPEEIKKFLSKDILILLHKDAKELRLIKTEKSLEEIDL